MQFLGGPEKRLRTLCDWLVGRYGIFSYGKFRIIPLANANDRDGEGQRNGRQLFPIESGQAETIETHGEDQRQDQRSLGMKSRVSIQKNSRADKLEYGSKEQKKATQTQFQPDRQVGIVRPAFASYQSQIVQFLPESLAGEWVFLNGLKCHVPPVKPVTKA